MQNIKVANLFKGGPAPLKANPSIFSSIDRQEAPELILREDRIEGDEVGNKVHHGGAERVLHHYPAEHYGFWRTLYPDVTFVPGLMGENLSTLGMTEKNVCIGDVYQIGEVVGVVTEPRKPCITIDHQFQVKGLFKLVKDVSRTGWFYRIKRPGIIRPGDRIILLERPAPLLTLDLCIRSLLIKANRPVLEDMAQNPDLSQNWKRSVQKLLSEL